MKNKVLKIGKPYVVDYDENCARLCAELFLDGEKVYDVWYEADKKYKDYLCYERADGFVVTLLLYAMEHSYDIVCDQCMSSELYYSLTTYLIPAIAKNVKKYHRIKIKASTTSELLPSAHAVGASVSGGVDSFYTLLKHYNKDKKEFNVTHLAFFNAGASGAKGGDLARERYKERIEWIKGVSDELKLDMVCVDTNINEFLLQPHEPTHTFRTLAIPLMMQKLFSKYYFASGFEYDQFEFAEAAIARYDMLNVQNLSTPNLKFYLSGAEASRNKKLEYISNHPITYDKLNVCVAEAHNCGKCDKCIRTMLELYGLKKLDLYKETFDVDYFYKHKSDYFKVMLALKNWKTNPVHKDWEEVYQLVKNDVTIPNRISGEINLAYRILRRKIYSTDFGKKFYDEHLKDKISKTKNI